LAKHPQLFSFAVYLKGKTTAMTVNEFKHTSIIDIFFGPRMELALRFEHKVRKTVLWTSSLEHTPFVSLLCQGSATGIARHNLYAMDAKRL
tara:strand:+ start:316 stop:588 length:273 start_codon:yes stop_codon:yes gene_type:complete